MWSTKVIEGRHLTYYFQTLLNDSLDFLIMKVTVSRKTFSVRLVWAFVWIDEINFEMFTSEQLRSSSVRKNNRNNGNYQIRDKAMFNLTNEDYRSYKKVLQ